MKLTVLKENLNKALVITGRSISSRPQLPILSNILLQAKENSLQISSTNLEIGINYTIGAKVEKEGEVTVPGKLLLDFINTISADKIEFELIEKNLIVKTINTESSFSTIAASEFPPFPVISGDKKTLPIDKLKAVIQRIVFAASTDETRPVLTGVKTAIFGGKISLQATDGYRLSLDSVEIPDKKEELRVVLPAQTLSEIVKIADEQKVKEVDFVIIENKNQVVFTMPGVSVFTRLIDGEYPNIEKIIPADFKTKITISKEDFYQCVKTAALFARGAANIVKIKVEKTGLRLSANTPQVGENQDFIEAKVEGEEGEIAFNYRFLLDLLSNFPDENVVIEMSGPLSPGVFKTLNIPSFLHIIMPVRVQG
jgi:DNA polymerase III subunit beta